MCDCVRNKERRGLKELMIFVSVFCFLAGECMYNVGLFSKQVSYFIDREVTESGNNGP